MLSFHKAELVDATDIADLVNTAYRGETSRLGWTTQADLLDGLRTSTSEVGQMIKRQDAFILMGALNNRVVATIACEQHENVAKFGMIAVKPSLQNKGYGKEMIQAAEAITLREWRVSGFYMSVITLRTELIQFYERLGYSRSGEFADFPQNEALWQAKVVSLTLEHLIKRVMR